MATLDNLYPLLWLKLDVIQVEVVKVDFVAQIRRLTLLDLNQAVLAVETKSLVSFITKTIHAGFGILSAPTDIWVMFVEDHGTAAVLVLLHWRKRVFFQPVNQEIPNQWVFVHPVTHQRHAESHLDDPIYDHFHVLKVFTLVRHQSEENLQILA